MGIHKIWSARRAGAGPEEGMNVDDPNARVVVTCGCGQKMKIPADARGKQYKCVKCGTILRVPESAPVAGAGQPAPGQPPSAGEPPAAPARERIGQMLIREGLITPAQLDEALSEQRKAGGKTFEILIRMGMLEKERLHAFLSRQPGVATINLANCNFEKDLVELVPKELALRELVLPIDRLGKLLTVAMACPLDAETIEEIQRITGLRVKAMLCKLDDINAAVERLYKQRRSAGGELADFAHILAATRPPAPVEAAAPPVSAPPASAPSVSAPQAAAESRASVLARALAAAEDVATSARDIARIIAVSAELSEEVVQAANSGMYGVVGTVDSAAMAVALLGKDGVAQMLRDAQS